MKKYRFLLIGATCFIILITLFLLYVIPYGKKVENFESEFKFFQSEINNTSNILRTTNSVAQFSASLVELLTQPAQLNEKRADLVSIQNQSNSMKKLWRKLNISPNDIEVLDEELNQTYMEIPELISKLIASDSRSVQATIKGCPSLSDIVPVLEKTKIQYDSLFNSIGEAIRSQNFHSSLLFNNRNVDKVNIEMIGNQGIETLSNLHNDKLKSVKESLLNTYNLKEVSQLTNNYVSWIKTSKNAIQTSLDLGADLKICQSLNSELDKDLGTMKELCLMFDKVIEAEKNANDILLTALKKMDESNTRLQNMEKFASSDDIQVVYLSWRQAEEDVVRANTALNYRGSGTEQQRIWNNLISKPQTNIETIYKSVLAHKNYVGEQYMQAVNEESTVAGNVSRTVQRGWDRLKKQVSNQVQIASNSRIAKELSIGVKLLILGTKAFYDLQSPDTDPLTWAFSYESEVNSLMNETEQVMNMEGPSLTGKNTIVEDFINVAYEKSFN